MSTQVSSPARSNMVGPVIAIVVGLVLVILAQYFLDHLADTSDTWHNIQHGTFLVGGLVIGIGGTLLWAFGRRA
jgi:multisubunit Na+/H+ antiporter MnhB subunit